jgi:4-hydroxybenzoyl-CoA thioesterase
MLTNTRKLRIEWCDCDPAGIVFYPRYFEMFDTSTTALFERGLGMSKHQFLAHYNAAGHPLVDTRARFIRPLTYSDDVAIVSAVEEFRRSSFRVLHRIMKGDDMAVEGVEVRVWAVRDPADPTRIRAQQVPPDIVEKLSLS